ncbi:MAG TPA: TonB-dependent receptor [Dongiaceae bacterium]|nr:TonB-dependent receptor [Dongiaceae bacterium]
MKRNHFGLALLILLALTFASSTLRAQLNTATLSGTVTDPQGLGVKTPKVTLTNKATGAEHTATGDESGRYGFVGLPPGTYTIAVDGGASFNTFTAEITLTVGQEGLYNPRLDLQGVKTTVTVVSETAVIEPTKSEVSQTVGQNRIDNLPINGRNYINFTLTNSQVNRDAAPSIGPAPTSGLNIGGQRARANMVSVDGADAVDNSVNGIRSTLSQEGVQEFQMILSNYNAEYGRATGGVVNIVTKGGGNEFHGDLFGYFRNKSFQARNAFSGEVDPASGDLTPVKQPYTRVQTGFTFGGPIKKDKTFFFLSYEYTQREETGFSSIGENNFGLQTFQVPTGPASSVPVQLTPAQGAALNSLLAAGDFGLAANYGLLLGSASSVALNKLDYGAVVTALSGGSITPVNPVSTPGGVLFQEFPVPVSCPFGATVNSLACTGFAGIGPNGSVVSAGAAPLPSSYVALNSIRGNYPISEKTGLWSARLDQQWSDREVSHLRVGFSPSQVTGLQSTSQNQVFGQNSGSRVGATHYRDVNASFEHDSYLSGSTINQFRFQFARRGLHFGFSPLPGGDQIGVNIPGYAYFGREPYSTVDRIERRFQFNDQIQTVKGNHTFKFGIDANLIQLRSAKSQIFELDFGGDVNFGGLAVSNFGLPDSVPTAGGTILLPGTTGLQSYGLGIPTTYIQGIGQSNEPFDNLPFAFYAQDTWRVTPKLTLNYGLRYDVEITPLFAAATPLNADAEKALGVTEGIPRDYNNFAPRFGFAYSPSSKTAIRGGYGIFYDHPLLAIAFNSVTADGGRSVQLISAGGTPSACGLVTADCANGLDGPTNLNGSSIFQGVLNALPSMFYLPNQQRFTADTTTSLFANQNYLAAGFPLPILPFTLPVDRKFVFGYAQQANLTIERQIAGNWTLSVAYTYTHGSHLNKPVDVNSTDPELLTNNLFNADAAGLGFTSPVTVTAPATNVAPTAGTCGVGVVAPSVLGQLFGCPVPLAGLNGKYVGTPAFFNFFRPSGPNPSFQGLVPGGYGTQVALANLAGYPQGFGVPVAFNSVDAQQSTGSSVYHGLTVTVNKRISKGFELLSSYTWSHAIDDSTDLQSTLEAQDSRFLEFERSNSDFDQRHRWVTSGVFTTGPRHGDGAWKSFLSNFTFAPLIELASGRPYSVITGTDYRLDLGSSNGRPSVGTGGGLTATSPYINGVTFTLPTTCLTNSGQPFIVQGVTPPAGCDGNLGRNPFVTPGFFEIDLRIAKKIPLGEKFNLDLIADGFNLLNRTNVTAVNQLCDPASSTTCFAGQPTAAADARQFQFAVKLSW